METAVETAGKPEAAKPRSVLVELVPGINVTERVHAQITSLAEVQTSGCVEIRAGDYRPNQQYHTAEGTLRHAPIARLLMMYRTGRVLDPKEFALHSCDNERCCNVAHLYLGTPTRNNLDIAARQRNPSGQTQATVEWVRAQVELGKGHAEIAREGRLRVHVVRGIAKGLTYTDRKGATEPAQIEEMRRLKGLGRTYESLAVQFDTSIARAHQLVTGKRYGRKTAQPVQPPQEVV